MRFCVRVDDVGWTPEKTADAGLQIAQRFHDAMCGLPYLTGIIPARVDDEGLAWLKSNPQGMTIALHGFEHDSKEEGGSEFAKLSQRECRDRLWWGSKIGSTEHLILPYNRYQPELTEACYLEGIKYIWGGANHDAVYPSRWPTPPPPYPLGRVSFVPSWAMAYGATLWKIGVDDVPLKVSLPTIIDLPGKAVLTLHITWEAARSATFDGVKWLVDYLGDRIISAEEYLS